MYFPASWELTISNPQALAFCITDRNALARAEGALDPILLGLFDISAAYRQCKTALSEWWHNAQVWGPYIWVCSCRDFGDRASGYLWDVVAGAMQHVLRGRLPRTSYTDYHAHDLPPIHTRRRRPPPPRTTKPKKEKEKTCC